MNGLLPEALHDKFGVESIKHSNTLVHGLNNKLLFKFLKILKTFEICSPVLFNFIQGLSISLSF